MPSMSTETGRGNRPRGASIMRQAHSTMTTGISSFWPNPSLHWLRAATVPALAYARPMFALADAKPIETSASLVLSTSQRLRKAAFATLASVAMVMGPCEYAEAARTGGHFAGHRTAHLSRKRRITPRYGYPRDRSASERYRVPLSVPLHALPPSFSPPDPSALARAPLLIGDIVAHPDLAAGIDLEALPLWASFLGLIAANVAGLALTIAVLRNLQDSGEALTVVKVQVAMLERRPQLQSKLRELISMIQVGQQGAWLILEEAILQLLEHQGTIAYASVTQEQLSSKKRAYTVFGELAEAEAAKANREEAVVRHMGETTDEDDPLGTVAGSGIFGSLMGGLGLSRGQAAKELTVITLLLAARGKLDIPTQVTDWPSLRHALQQVTGLSSDRVMAVELLWTPRNETDYLTRDQLERDYPDLAPFGSKNLENSHS